jgi:DNA topoisomerase-3
MIALAASIAARKGIKPPRGLKSNGAICRAFLDRHAPARAQQAMGPGGKDGASRPPSEAMRRFAQALARERGIECPPEVVTDFVACKAFLDEQAPQRTRSGGAERRSAAHRRRPPADSPRINATTAESAAGGDRKPTEPMLRFARRLARERGVAIPPGVLDSFQRCKAFLDQHAGQH